MAASLDPPSLSAGAVLGDRYRLERRIAAGGMASVWEAHDDVLARQVAVKVLHPHLGADEQFVARFKREAVAAAGLGHPSIVAIYDTCSQGGTEAIVMELVRGPTLRAELDRRGRFAPADAARIVAEVADALAAAHAAGIVHRDVKPANVLLSADGRVLVADFGIAKAADGLDLTGTDTTLGTAKYLAPEQVDATIGPVDARADVYAAGVILYELLCGMPPFVADTEAGTALARLHRDPVGPGTLVAGLDPSIESIVLRALARNPAHRIPSAAELRDVLRAAAREGVPHDGPPTAPVATVATGPGDATGVVPVDGTRVAPAPDPTPARPAPPARPQGAGARRWAPFVLGSIVVVAVSVAAVLWFSTGDRVNGGTPDAGPPEGGSIALAGATSFDPEGDDGQENEDRVAAAIDGDEATEWRTSCYSTAAFGNLKAGVGLVVELTAPGALSQLHVDSGNAGWRAQVYVADAPGRDLAAWGEPVAEDDGAAETTTFELGGAEGRFVLLWITDLGPPSPDCDDRPNGVSVTELSVV